MFAFETPKQVVKATVLGIKSFSGDIDGSHIDTASIFVITPLDDTRGTAKGYATVEYKAGTSEIFQKVKHLPFPHEAELVIENVTSGKVVKTVVRDYKPVVQQNAGKVAEVVAGKGAKEF
ncbi:hypothetical protein [Chitinimonas naiadis]